MSFLTLLRAVANFLTLGAKFELDTLFAGFEKGLLVLDLVTESASFEEATKIWVTS